MRCPNCRAEYVDEDMHCRQCGAELRSSSTSIVPTQTNFPAALYNPQLPRRVAAGVGALALGVGIELLRRNLLARLRPTQVARQSLPAISGIKDIIAPNQRKITKLPKGYEIHERVVYMERVIRRAD